MGRYGGLCLLVLAVSGGATVNSNDVLCLLLLAASIGGLVRLWKRRWKPADDWDGIAAFFVFVWVLYSSIIAVGSVFEWGVK